MKFLVTSDLHLANRIWLHRPIEGDSYHSWNQIVGYAINHDIRGIILAGDILDKQTNLSKPIQQLAQGLSSLKANSCQILFNQGQHEYQKIPWVQSIGYSGTYPIGECGSHPIWLHERNFTYLQAKGYIAGSDYRSREDFQEFLRGDNAKKAGVLVCHQVWSNFMGENITTAQASFDDIPVENKKAVVTGDFHDHRVVWRPGSAKAARWCILSPGSTHLRSLAEPVDKQFFVVDFRLDSKKQEAEVESHPLYTRRLLKVDLAEWYTWAELEHFVSNSLSEFEKYAVTHKLPEELRKPILVFTHAAGDSEWAQRFQTEFQSSAHLFFRIKQEKKEEERPVLEHLASTLGSKDTTRVPLDLLLDSFINKETESLAHELALELLGSLQPEQTLHNWIKKKTGDFQ
jgi:DNA repair exonuclease SbcCD nuclease subunit